MKHFFKLNNYPNIAMTKNKVGRKLKNLRTDNADVCTRKETENYLIEQSLEHELTVSYSSAQSDMVK